MVNSNWKEKELPHHLVPLPEFHCFVFAEGEEEDEEGEGMNTQMLDHLQKISVHYLQQVCLLITGLMHHMNIDSSVIATTDRKIT